MSECFSIFWLVELIFQILFVRIYRGPPVDITCAKCSFGNFDHFLAEISENSSYADLIEKEGLSLGTSCGVNIAGAIRLGKLLGPGKTIVTILCDKSDKYNSKMFNKSFLKEKGLPYPHWI